MLKVRLWLFTDMCRMTKKWSGPTHPLSAEINTMTLCRLSSPLIKSIFSLSMYCHFCLFLCLFCFLCFVGRIFLFRMASKYSPYIHSGVLKFSMPYREIYRLDKLYAGMTYSIVLLGMRITANK